jgi:hypothetical protein
VFALGTTTTYHGKRHGPVRQKVVVQAGQIGAAAGHKLNRRLDIKADVLRGFHLAEDLVLLLL